MGMYPKETIQSNFSGLHEFLLELLNFYALFQYLFSLFFQCDNLIFFSNNLVFFS